MVFIIKYYFVYCIMKYLILTLLLSISLNSFSQMNEKRAIKEKRIDFSREFLYFELAGLIELNGVIFDNDTCKCPIIYKATINTTELINKCTGDKYSFVKFVTFGKNKIIRIEGVRVNGLHLCDGGIILTPGLELLDYDYTPD